jgi:hypothetical protein
VKIVVGNKLDKVKSLSSSLLIITFPAHR